MADYLPLFTFICLISGKPCQIANHYYKQNAWFQGVIYPDELGQLEGQSLTLILVISGKLCQIAR